LGSALVGAYGQLESVALGNVEDRIRAQQWDAPHRLGFTVFVALGTLTGSYVVERLARGFRQAWTGKPGSRVRLALLVRR
jgi:hypothetical protein